MSGTSGPLVPTFHGFIQNSMDGLILFEACLSGKLHHVPRRPHDRERTNLIQSGSIFIYEENASGIKRWTDGVAWSPSRILGNFLIYRELDKPFPPGEKKRAMKRKRSSQTSESFNQRVSEEANEPDEALMPPTPPSPKPEPAPLSAAEAHLLENDKEMERQLIGSLVDSYGFRHEGLVKKTMSISVNGVSHHLVSYYKIDDVKQRLLHRPLSDPRLTNITVRPELYLKQNFRSPVEETEHYAVDPNNMHAHPGVLYSPQGMYSMRPGQYAGPQHYPVYPSSASMYGGAPANSWPTPAPSTIAPSYGSQHYAPHTYNYDYSRTNSVTSHAPAMKTEDHSSGPSPYNAHTQFSNPFQGTARNTPASTYTTAPSQYSAPMRPPSSYGSGQHAQHPSSNAQPTPPHSAGSQAVYAGGSTPSHGYESSTKATSHQYAIQSPAQAYPGAASSPHPSLKSPGVAGQIRSAGSSSGQPSMAAYRQHSYASHDSASSAEMGGLGINQSYSAAPQAASASYTSGGYSAYAPPPQTARAGTDGAAGGGASSSGHY